MQKYFQVIDSLSIRDTGDEQFMLLRAYHRNDTAFLNREYKQVEVEVYLKDLHERTAISCKKKTAKLQEFDEAYRFGYSGAFCLVEIEITVGKKVSTYTIDVQIDTFDINTGQCLVSKQFTKPLKELDWDKLEKDIKYCDFWGMLEDNSIHGMDGTSVFVYGYRKSFFDVPTFKKVERWSPERTALGELLRTAFDLSGVKGTCLNNRVKGE